MKKYFLSLLGLLSLLSTIWGQQALVLSNLVNNTPIPYTYNFIAPLNSNLLLRNGHQLTGTQINLTNNVPFQVYYDPDTLSTTSNSLDITNNPILMAGKGVRLASNFRIGGEGGIFRAIIENKLADYDTNTSGVQGIDEYDPDFRLRYFMSIFGPRLIFRDGQYRYDFHQGADMIDLERPADEIPIADLPNIQCMCDGTVVEFVKLDNPADIDNPNGIGRRTSIECSGETLVGTDRTIEATGEGLYLVVKCDEQDQFPISLGFSDNDIYTAYRHLYDFAQDFNIGDPIKKGDLIGKMGQTGITSNYHLHFSALRRACSETPAKRFINVHPMYLFNPESNPHLLRKLAINPDFDNNSSSIKHQEINPEIYFLNYDTITVGANPIVRIALPYSQTSLQKIVIRDKNGIAPNNEWIFNFLERGIEEEVERDKNHWDMNGDGLLDTVFIYHFNRGTSASYLFDSHEEEAHFEGHPGRDWPITATGLYRTSAYILDIKIVNYTGNKDDLEVEVVDIWGNGIKGILDVAPFHSSLTLRNAPIAASFTDFKIMPTPSTSRLIRLELPDIEVDSPIQIQIINTMGQVIWQQVRQSKKVIGLDLRDLKKGSYRVVLEIDGVSSSKQFVLL